jgi:hypothetical protein
MTPKDYITLFESVHPLTFENREELQKCKSMYDAWRSTKNLSILHQCTLHCGSISKEDYMRIAVAYAERCLHNLPLSEKVTRKAISSAIIHTLHPNSDSNKNIYEALVNAKNLEFYHNDRFYFLKDEINIYHNMEDFPEWYELGRQKGIFDSVKTATINLLLCAMEDDIKKSLNNFLYCAEFSRSASCLVENEQNQCMIYRSIISNPFNKKIIKKNTFFAKLKSLITGD